MTNCNLGNAAQFNFAKSLTHEEWAEVEENSFSRTVNKGDVIFEEDELLQKIFCIQEGACKFSKVDNKGKVHITKFLGRGELMGRRSLISNKGAKVTATALTDTTLCCIDKKPVLQSLKKNNCFCMDVLKGFVNDTEEEDLRIELFENHENIKKRLAGLLIYLNKKFGTDKEGRMKVSFKRGDLANVLGTSSEYVITLLGRFKKAGYINIKKGKMKLLSEKSLHKML